MDHFYRWGLFHFISTKTWLFYFFHRQGSSGRDDLQKVGLRFVVIFLSPIESLFLVICVVYISFYHIYMYTYCKYISVYKFKEIDIW